MGMLDDIEVAVATAFFRSFKPNLNFRTAQFRNYNFVTSDPQAIKDAGTMVSRGLAKELTEKEFEQANSFNAE